MDISKQRLILFIASLLGGLAVFLPWAAFLRISVLGIDGDGRITLVLFGLAFLVCCFGKLKKPLASEKYLVVVAGVVSAGIAIFHIVDLVSSGIGFEMSLAPGVGLYLTALAGLTLAVVPFLKLDKGNS